MKICHVITRMILGGAQENTLLTLEGLRRDTPWAIHLAYGTEVGSEGTLLPQAAALGVHLHPLRFMRRDLHPLDDGAAYFELRRLLARERFDLVHTHSSKAGVLGRLAARHAGVPRIVHTIHGLAFDEYQPAWRHFIYRAMERLAAGRGDMTLAVCEAMARQALEAGVGDRTRMRVVFSGFPLDEFLKLPSRPLDGRWVVGLIARMFPLKGHEDLMKLAPMILNEWDDVDFRVVGDGPLRGAWEAWLAQHPQWRERVILAGRVSPDEIPSQIERMDLVIHLSWREGLARVIPQALAAGRPVCSYDVGGAGEVVRNGVTGWIVPAGDLAGVRQAIGAAKADPAAARKMAEAGREEVRARFAVEVMQREIVKIYREMGLS